MEIFESPCIETRRLENMNSFALQNLRVLKFGDSKISVFKPRRCLEHGDKICIKKISNSNFKNSVKVSKLNLLRKNPIACHYINWSLISCKKKLENPYILFASLGDSNLFG